MTTISKFYLCVCKLGRREKRAEYLPAVDSLRKCPPTVTWIEGAQLFEPSAVTFQGRHWQEARRRSGT